MRRFRGIKEKYFEIATYVKEEHIRRFGKHLQEATREAMRRVLAMKEEDIIAVSEEEVKNELKGAIWKVIYTDDKAIHERLSTPHGTLGTLGLPDYFLVLGVFQLHTVH